MKNRKGLTMVELMIVLVLTGILACMIPVLSGIMNRNMIGIQDLAEIQREIKLATIRMQRDIGNAGGGFPGSTGMIKALSDTLEFKYIDRLGKLCSTNETAHITYQVTDARKSVEYKVKCGIAAPVSKIIMGPYDSVSLNFAYQDETGATAALPDEIRLVKYSINAVSHRSGKTGRQSRRVPGTVFINNVSM
jgi:prepilin-type N-terminal cleavage/methylation domain-containing protein